MNDIWTITCGAGLHDGLNPCIFMTIAVFIALGFWLSSSSVDIIWSRIIFVLTYMLGSFYFNFGLGQMFILSKGFIFAAKISYFILAVWAFVSGVLFLKEWFLLYRKQNTQDLTNKKIELSGTLVVLTTIILGVLLSSMATLWPINTYVLILGNASFAKGQWQLALPFLMGYILMSMWPLWLVWSFLSIKKLQPSLLRIICASIFFTASSCIILIFK